MRSSKPFLIAAGEVPDSAMRLGSIALTEVWGGELKEYSCIDSPNKVLNNLTNDDGLILLKGDVAKSLPEGGSWLEALGAWKQPIILLVIPLPSGEIPGVALAYSALCRELKVPLVGVIQLGGHFVQGRNFSDGVVCCGWLPANSSDMQTLKNLENNSNFMDTCVVVSNLRIRLNQILY